MIVIGRWNLTRKPTIQKQCAVYSVVLFQGTSRILNCSEHAWSVGLDENRGSGEITLGGGTTLHHDARSFTFTFRTCYVTTRQTFRVICVRKPLPWQWNGDDSWFRLFFMIFTGCWAHPTDLWRMDYGLVTPAIYSTTAIASTIVWTIFCIVIAIVRPISCVNVPTYSTSHYSMISSHNCNSWVNCRCDWTLEYNSGSRKLVSLTVRTVPRDKICGRGLFWLWFGLLYIAALNRRESAEWCVVYR